MTLMGRNEGEWREQQTHEKLFGISFLHFYLEEPSLKPSLAWAFLKSSSSFLNYNLVVYFISPHILPPPSSHPPLSLSLYCLFAHFTPAKNRKAGAERCQDRALGRVETESGRGSKPEAEEGERFPRLTAAGASHHAARRSQMAQCKGRHERGDDCRDNFLASGTHYGVNVGVCLLPQFWFIIQLWALSHSIIRHSILLCVPLSSVLHFHIFTCRHHHPSTIPTFTQKRTNDYESPFLNFDER